VQHAPFATALLAALPLLAACAPTSAADAPPPPTTAEARAQGAALAQACDGRDGWSDPAPPARIHGDTFYVGTCGISVLLITSPAGHVLVDGATAEAVPAILANIRTLGFDPRDVKLIVGSHEHYDHMGGFAGLAAATGAQVWTSAPARASVTTGAVDPADPQFGLIEGMTPVPVANTFADGAPITLAGHTFAPVPMLTPGHTDGGTSWTWQSCEGGACVNFAYVDSLSAVSRDDYRFTDHPERVAPFAATFAKVAAMPCDILVTPHHSGSNLFPRLAGAAPLIDPTACRTLVEASRQRLDTRLAEEATN
jgi:metallo-beta-lactamase class B